MRALIRRTVSEILHRAAAGETARAISMVDAVLAGLPPGRDRVAVMTLRVGLDFGQAVELLDRAEREAQGDELLRGRILDLRVYHTLMYHGRVDEARRLESEALDIARRHHDDELEMLSSATLSTAALFAGAPQPELLERASELSRPGLRLGRWPDVERARQCLWNGELGTARRIFEGLHEMTVRSGIEFQRPYRLLDLAMLEIVCGNLEIAAALADDGLESANDAGNQTGAMWVRYPDGLANAHLGNSDRARRAVDELAEWGRRHDEPTRLVMAHHVAGVLALATGDPAASLRELEAAVALDQTLGGRHPGGVPVLPDAIEAAAAAGAAERAGELLVELGAQSATLDVPWVHAVALRARGVVGAVTGDSGRRRRSPRRPRHSMPSAPRSTRRGRAGGAVGHCAGRAAATRPLRRSSTPAGGSRRWAPCRGRRLVTAELEQVGSRSGVERPDGRRDGCRVARRRRGAQSRDRRRSLRERGHGRGAPHEGVPQARCPVADRARRPYGRISSLARRCVRYGRAPVAPDPVAVVAARLVGRDQELERLRRVVTSPGPGGRSLLIRGDEGIGKTAVWRRGIEEHRAAGHRILVTRTCEDELHAPMTGLIDLLEDADPQGDLLDSDADVFDRGRSVELTLRRLAAASPVVLAIDDLQWLDTVSLRSLRYALRRLEATR